MAEVSLCKVEIAQDKCKGCELCVCFCPVKHLEISCTLNKKGIKPAKVKESAKCTGCGFCFLICPEACIEIYAEDRGQMSEDRGQKTKI
jgi:2-oxoglutarate ferredoxin oxidoreductase subunit delta